MRIVVIVLLVAIVASLFSALSFMFRSGSDDQTKMVRALSIRVGLSVALFVLLMLAYYFGWIGQRL